MLRMSSVSGSTDRCRMKNIEEHTFTDMELTECMWKAYDGQQPDETLN